MLNVSFWFAIVTVFPGLVTLAVLVGVVAALAPSTSTTLFLDDPNGWVLTGGAVTLMVVTQLFGILLEEAMLRGGRRRGSLGASACTITLLPGTAPGDTRRPADAPGGDPSSVTGARSEAATLDAAGLPVSMDPYEEFTGLYVALSGIEVSDNAHRHVERAAAQFFLTVNTSVSFLLGFVAAVVLMALGRVDAGVTTLAVVLVLLLSLLLATWGVAVIRFRVLGWALWTLRTRRLLGPSSAD